jgi:hypothetical protein
MNRISTTLSVTAIALAGLTLSAEDFQPLMKATQVTWPAKQHIGVICNYDQNQDQVWDLARAAGEGARITVADTRTLDRANAAAMLLAEHHIDYVVLMPHDPNFFEGSFGATVAVKRLASKGVPAVGTTPIALKQGAVFSAGDGTDGQVLVTEKVIGTVDVTLPDRSLVLEKSSLVLHRKGMATVSVQGAK